VLEPAYGEPVVLILDKIENDPTRRALWNAICDAIDLICDHPDSGEARRDELNTTHSKTVWQVPIRCPIEDDNWVLLWYPDGPDAKIVYVGSGLFR
jgi:hypothetical protein